MGELLRAVLDATCVRAAPAFYSASIASDAGGGGPGNVLLARRSTVLQCKADTWFLMMGYSIAAAYGTIPGPQWDDAAGADLVSLAFQIQDLANSAALSVSPVARFNAGGQLNDATTLAEYYLWPPSSLIGVTMDVPTQVQLATPVRTFVTLQGIEYQMPAGKG